MAHNVETMAYTNEVPWHGLGKKVDGNQTVKQMLKAAGLDWRVDRQPVIVGRYGEDGKILMPGGAFQAVEGFAALVRDKDQAVFDIVGRDYTPTQNEQAFEFFNEFVKAGKATMETAGSLRGGRLVWGLANLNVSFKLKNNDVVKGYLLCVNPHQQGKSRIFKFTSVRVVCNNTLCLALGSGGSEHRQSHRGEFDDVKIEQAKVALGIARDQMEQFEFNARKLEKLKMKQDQIVELLCPIFTPNVEAKDVLKDLDKAPAKIRVLLDVLKNAPGAIPDSGWGVLNAATYYADHIASRSSDKRLTNSWLGKTATQKEKVLEALLQL